MTTNNWWDEKEKELDNKRTFEESDEMILIGRKEQFEQDKEQHEKELQRYKENAIENLTKLKANMCGYIKLDDEISWLVSLRHDLKDFNSYVTIHPCEGYTLDQWIEKRIIELKQLANQIHTRTPELEKGDVGSNPTEKANFSSSSGNNNVCKNCGHDKEDHRYNSMIGEYCNPRGCNCKKFEPKEVKA